MEWFTEHWHWLYFTVGVLVGLGVRLLVVILEDW